MDELELSLFDTDQLRDAALAGAAALTVLKNLIENIADQGDAINERVVAIEAEIRRRLEAN